MRLIGHTESGSMLVEMSLDEWQALMASGPQAKGNRPLPQSANYSLADIRDWAFDFANQFRQSQLKYYLPSRIYKTLNHALIGVLNDGLEVAIEQDSKYHSSYTGYQDRFYDALRLVVNDGEFLSFDEWIDILPARREQLLRLHNLGPVGVDNILDAIGELRRERVAV